jgi:hypothetical protein
MLGTAAYALPLLHIARAARGLDMPRRFFSSQELLEEALNKLEHVTEKAAACARYHVSDSSAVACDKMLPVRRIYFALCSRYRMRNNGAAAVADKLRAACGMEEHYKECVEETGDDAHLMTVKAIARVLRVHAIPLGKLLKGRERNGIIKRVCTQSTRGFQGIRLWQLTGVFGCSAFAETLYFLPLGPGVLRSMSD